MKRPLNDHLTLPSKKSKSSSFSYFISINTGLTYNSILGYRVIIGNGQYPPQIQNFNNQTEAETYVSNYHLQYDYCIIRAVVLQEGFYLEDDQGKIVDINSGKKYQFINKTRLSEWDLNKLDYRPIFKIF